MRWDERIALAKTTGMRTDEDVDLAGDWITCACSEQDLRIPREDEDNFQPKDEQLTILGLEFFNAIEENKMELAEKVLHEIELRSSEILSKLGY